MNSTSKVSVSSIMEALDAQRRLNSSLTATVVRHSSDIVGLRTDVDGLTVAVGEVVEVQGNHSRSLIDHRSRLGRIEPKLREVDARTQQSLDWKGAGVIAALVAALSLGVWASAVFFGHWDPLTSVVGNHTWHWTVKHYSGMLWFHVIVYSLICTGIAFAAAACVLPTVSNVSNYRRVSTTRWSPPEPDSVNEL